MLDIDPPVGDPGEMRTKAARIEIECSGLLAVADAIESARSAMLYHCIAGDRFRDKLGARRGELDGVVHELRRLQHEIRREAGRVEAAQDAWRHLVRSIEANPLGAAEDPAALGRQLRSIVEDL